VKYLISVGSDEMSGLGGVNGVDGTDGVDGADGFDEADGADGVETDGHLSILLQPVGTSQGVGNSLQTFPGPMAGVIT
jgi:hypothetical protein